MVHLDGVVLGRRLYGGQVGALTGHEAALDGGLVLRDSRLLLTMAVLAHLGVVRLVDDLMCLVRCETHSLQNLQFIFFNFSFFLIIT